MQRRLIVNADDFGFTRGVNEGIIEAYRHGVLTATTLMANGEAFDDAVSLARQNPALDVGCHLVLVGGSSVLDSSRSLPASLFSLIAAVGARRIRIYDEFAAQLRKTLEVGIRPTHLDTHKHTHLLPPVLEAVARLSAEFAIPWVRAPFDFPLTNAAAGASVSARLLSRCLRFRRPAFLGMLTRHGCRSTDHFAGFQLTGHFRAGDLPALFRELPEGTTEFMCHPGFCTAELRAAPTRLTDSRERELDALVAPETREALRDEQIEVLSYRDLQVSETGARG